MAELKSIEVGDILVLKKTNIEYYEVWGWPKTAVVTKVKENKYSDTYILFRPDEKQFNEIDNYTVLKRIYKKAKNNNSKISRLLYGQKETV